MQGTHLRFYTYENRKHGSVLIYEWLLEFAKARGIHGGSAFVIPLIQDYAYLSLEPVQIEVPLRGALSAENIRVNVPSVFTVAIDTKP